MVELGRSAGRITVDQVLDVPRASPDPTPAFIATITEQLGAEGIVVDPEEPVPAPVPAPASHAPPPARPAGRGPCAPSTSA